MNKYEMRYDALPPRLKWNELSPTAMHDMHTHLSVPNYEPLHTWSVAYQHPGANQIRLEFEYFLKVILLVSHHNSHPDFVTLNQISSKGVYFSFHKTNPLNVMSMLYLPLRLHMLMYAMTIWFIYIFKAYSKNKQFILIYEFSHRIHKSLQLMS